jgi:DNA-binding transcriptional MerR regulator
MRISELAAELGVPPSTLRYYERIGIVAGPPRTESGYRAYDDEAVARLRFVTRAKRIGLTLQQIAEVLPIWDGVHCAGAHDEVSRLVERKRAEVLQRVAELQRFAERLGEVHAALLEAPPPLACRPDLSCCVPSTEDVPVALISGSSVDS